MSDATYTPAIKEIGDKINKIIAKLHGEIVRIIKMPEVTDRIAAEGAEFVGNTPDEFTAFVAAEIIKWSKVVKATGARVE